MLPNVNITILNGQLGSAPGSADGIAGLVLSGVAVSGQIALAEAKQIFSLKEAEDLGLDAAYDTTNTTDVHKQISEFYDGAGTGAELWIMIVAKTQTMATTCDVANAFAVKLLDAAQGTIRLLGVTRVPDGSYSPTVTEAIDPDVPAAVLKAHALAEAFAALVKPLRVLIGGRGFTGVPGSLRNFRANTNNRVGVVLGSTAATYPGATAYKGAAVGLALGRMAANAVQRSIARVKDGDLGLLNAYTSDGVSTLTYESAWGSIHDKGYIFFRKFANKNGFYFNDDCSCSPVTDDYANLSRGRVIDKVHTIAYNTYVNEINDDIETDEAGYISPAIAKDYQRKIENAIELAMVPAEISAVQCIIDPKQNILSTNKVTITKLAIRPKGYAKFIDVPIGFSNPQAGT